MNDERQAKLECDIRLPASKSESNRALMVAAYGGFSPDFQNLSDSEDTLVLKKALEEIRAGRAWQTIDVGDCGTAARFLLVFLACRDGQWLLSGSERLRQRPMAPLVEALQQLGANVQYVERQGVLPLRIQGKTLSGGAVALDASRSSQFASALLLAAPMWAQGLRLELLGQLNSLPYIDMTLAVMRHFGASAQRLGRTILVEPKPYREQGFVVASDWSAASYWFEMAALSEECHIRLLGLSTTSLQGDSIVAKWMQELGVASEETDKALVLRKMPFEKHPLSFDFTSCPDLFPAVAATCAGLQIEAVFTGIANLSVKESDRVEAMRLELARIGTALRQDGEDVLILKPSDMLPFFDKTHPLSFKSHGDHRVVMALAPLALRIGALAFDHPQVVAKSYPNYWKDVGSVPFLWQNKEYLLSKYL